MWNPECELVYALMIWPPELMSAVMPISLLADARMFAGVKLELIF